MDFSGATTLMTTFNMGSSPIQSQIIFSNSFQIIAKQPVRAFDRQREHICDLKQHAQRGMVSCTSNVPLASLTESKTNRRRSFDYPEK